MRHEFWFVMQCTRNLRCGLFSTVHISFHLRMWCVQCTKLPASHLHMFVLITNIIYCPLWIYEYNTTVQDSAQWFQATQACRSGMSAEMLRWLCHIWLKATKKWMYLPPSISKPMVKHHLSNKHFFYTVQVTTLQRAWHLCQNSVLYCLLQWS